MSKSMLLAVLCRIQVILRKSSFSRSSFSRSGKRRPWSNFWVIENRVVSYTSLCLKVVIEPFPSDFKRGLRFLGLQSSVFGLRFQGSSFSRHPRPARFSPNAVIIKPYCRLKIELSFLDIHNISFRNTSFLCRSFL